MTPSEKKIRARLRDPLIDDLGCDVTRRTEDVARPGHRVPFEAPPSHEAEVDELHEPASDEDVLGLEVAVDDAMLVHVAERVQHLKERRGDAGNARERIQLSGGKHARLVLVFVLVVLRPVTRSRERGSILPGLARLRARPSG